MSLLDRLRPNRKTVHHLHTMDPTVRLLKDAAADAQRSRLPQMAAALSYRTFFGLFPIVAIALWVLSIAVNEKDLLTLVGRTVEFAGLKSISISNEFVGPAPGPEAISTGISGLDQQITSLIAHIKSINFTAIGVIGVGMLVYAAISMIVEVERAFNQIYRVPRGRSWARRLTNYTTMLVYGPICLFLSFYLQVQLKGWLDHVGEHRVLNASGLLVMQTLGQSLQLIISFGLLMVLYTVVPNTKVKMWPAMAGALLSALLFEASKYGFARYVEFSASASYARLYGSLGLLPLFMLWVYFAWTIVLFGLQVSYQLQYGRNKIPAQPLSDLGPTIVDPAACVLIMISAARAHSIGQSMTIPTLATSTGLNQGVVGLVLGRLSEHGMVARVDRGDALDAEPSYILARAPGTIRVAELLHIGFEVSTGPESNPALASLRQAQIDAAGSQTLAQIARLNPDGSASEAQSTLISIRTGNPDSPRGVGISGAGSSKGTLPAPPSVQVSKPT